MEHQTHYHTVPISEIKQASRLGISYDQISGFEPIDQGLTLRQFGALQLAFAHFNKHLFNSRLTAVMFSHTQKAHSKGYYKPLTWFEELQRILPEINISPSTLLLEPKIMSVAVWSKPNLFIKFGTCDSRLVIISDMAPIKEISADPKNIRV